MATFMDRKPDHIDMTDARPGQRATLRFVYLPTGRKQNELGVKFVVVTSPTNDTGWQATLWTCRGPAAYAPLKERDLTPDEIKHFERLMNWHLATYDYKIPVPLDDLEGD